MLVTRLHSATRSLQGERSAFSGLPCCVLRLLTHKESSPNLRTPTVQSPEPPSLQVGTLAGADAQAHRGQMSLECQFCLLRCQAAGAVGPLMPYSWWLESVLSHEAVLTPGGTTTAGLISLIALVPRGRQSAECRGWGGFCFLKLIVATSFQP